MTTRTERTRCLHTLPEMMMRIAVAKTSEERMELYRAAIRHYPCMAEWDAIAEKAREWLEKREC